MHPRTSSVPRSDSNPIDEPSPPLASDPERLSTIVIAIPSDAFEGYEPSPRLLALWDAFMSPSEEA